MINTEQLLEILLNGLTFTQFVAYAVLMLVGAAIHFTLDVEKSVKKDPETPKKFSFRFMIWDNVLRFIGVLLMILVIIPYFDVFMGTELNPQMALIFGLSIDLVIGRLAGGAKGLPAIKAQREEFVKKLNEK